MDFDLSRLGPREFEHLVQALAIAELGPNVMPFGDGPDGGRDAVFNGEVRISDFERSGSWSGYGVIQAKYRMRTEDPASNLSWLAHEMTKEFKGWAGSGDRHGAKKRKIPTYYMLATNIRLSAVSVKGGIDAATRALNEQARKLGVKDCILWHYDSIARLLEIHAGIRRSYSGFLTTGDVLASLQAILDNQKSFDIGKSLRIHAGQQLYAKQYVGLGESGYDQETRLRLSDVAIDLPARIERSSKEKELGAEVNVIKYVLEKGDRNLSARVRDLHVDCGMMIIGGPGQRKSTLAQLICQAYRAAIVGSTDSSSLGRATDTAHAEVVRSFEHLGIVMPSNHRWPIYVELSTLSDSIGGEIEPNLLRYLSGKIDLGGDEIRPSDLLSWLKAWPSVIVLDGLDEVPHYLARSKIIEAVGRFIAHTSAEGCDVYVVATTRPQGYNNEFGEFELGQIELCNLRVEQAVRYAQGVVSARYHGDKERIREIVERVSQAAEEKSTARLMRSPLQGYLLQHHLFERSFQRWASRRSTGTTSAGH